MHGDYISYDANAEYAEVIGGTKSADGTTSSGRVKAIIQPKNKTPAAKPEVKPLGLLPDGVSKTLKFSNKLELQPSE